MAAVSTASAFVFGDSLSLTVTTVDGVSGISTGAIILLESTVANTSLTVSQPVTTNGGQDITFTFDNMTLGAGVAAAGHRVTLEPFSSGQLIDVGGPDAAGTLGLAQSDLSNVAAATLQIGDSTSGDITVSNAITLTNVTTLDLETGGGVSETTSPNVGTIAVADLVVRAVNAVTLTNANDVSANTLAADVTGAGQGFSFVNSGDLTIGTVDGVSGITTNGGAIAVSTTNGDLTVNQPVRTTASGGTITLSSTGAFTSNAAGTVSTQGGALNIVAGGDATIGGDIFIGGGVGGISISSAGSVQVNAGVAVVGQGTGGIAVTADSAHNGVGAFTSTAAGTLSTRGGAISIGAGDDVTLGGSVTVNGGTGAVSISSDDSVLVNAAVFITGTSGITIVADRDHNGDGGFTNSAAGTLTTGGGPVMLIAAADITIGGAVSTTTLNGSTIFMGYDITVTGNQNVFVQAAISAASFGKITVNADNDGSGTGDFVSNAAGTLTTQGGDVTIRAGDNLDLQTGSIVTSDTGTVTLDIGFDDNDGDGSSLSTIAGTVQGTSPTVTGGSGANNLLIDFTGGASLPDGLTDNGGPSGKDALTVSDANGSAAHTYTLSDTSVKRDSTTITISNLAGVTAAGGNLSDAFNVTPSATTAFTVNGGLPNPPASPGDMLNVNLTGVTNPILIKTFSRATGYSGSWAFANRQEVNFTGIESLLPPEASTAVLKADGELDLFNTLTGQLQMLSPAGTILSVSAVQAGDGATDVFAITTGLVGAQFQNTLWEFSTVTGWSQLSTGSFAQISAATNPAGQGVVFGVLTDGSLYEQDPANGTGLNAGFAPLSPSGTIASVSAVTDLSGNPTVYAVVTNTYNLWQHSPALPGDGWREISSGAFQSVSAGLNGAGQAVVYGVVSDGSLWEQNPAVGTGLNAGWTQLSGTGGAPTAFLSAAAGRPNDVFGIAADHTLWEHTAAGFQQLSPGSFAQVSPSETAAQGSSRSPC